MAKKPAKKNPFAGKESKREEMREGHMMKRGKSKGGGKGRKC